MKTVVLSDVHLDPAPEGQAQRSDFARFLDTLPLFGIQRLIVLGDLFDFWFEYRHVVFSGYFDVLCALGRLRKQGIELHLVCGNHDFWAGRFLEQHLGFAVHRESVSIQFGNQRVLLAHGDGLNPQDRGYLFYKRLARSRIVITLFGLLHPDLAMAIAKRVSKTSRRITLQKDPAKGTEAEALRVFARGILEKGDADVVLCGHAHAPTREEYPSKEGTGLYINTGDWMYHRTYVEWDGTDFVMRTG